MKRIQADPRPPGARENPKAWELARHVSPASLWSSLAVLAFFEAQYLTDRFDTRALQERDELWARLLCLTPFLFPCAIAVAAGLLTFGWSELRALPRLVTKRTVGMRTVAGLIGHAAGLACFSRVTTELFERVPPGGSMGWVLFGTWVAAGGLSAASILWTAMPLDVWRHLGSRGTAALSIGIATGACAWAAGQSTVLELWHPLGIPTLDATYVLLSGCVESTVLDRSMFLIGTPDFVVRVGIGCSGYEGIGLTWIFLSAYLWLQRTSLRFPHALLLLPLGTLVVWCANVIRIVALIWIGHAWSPDLAIGAFHTKAGWVLFCAVALGLVALADRARIFHLEEKAAVRSSKAREHEGGSPAPWLLPLTVVLGVQLLGSPFAEDGAAFLAIAMAAGAATLWAFRERYSNLRCRSPQTASLAGVLVFLIWWLAAPPGTAEALPDAVAGNQEATRLQVASLASLAGILGSVLVVPFVEELAFRGYLMRRIISADFAKSKIGAWNTAAFLFSSLLFGLAHERWIVGTLAGLVYAAVLCRRRSLGDAILAHAVTNALLEVAP